MKNQLLLLSAFSMLTFFSCTKKSNNATNNSNNNNNNSTSTTDSNMVTVVDNGATYIEKGGGLSSPSALENILCTLSKETSASSLKLYIVGTKYPVQMQLTLNEVGPVAGTGVYALADTPTTYSHYYQGTFTETFSGGQTYNIDTSYVTITTASNNNVAGTYRLHVTNTSGSKVINGTIDCKAATVN